MAAVSSDDDGLASEDGHQSPTPNLGSSGMRVRGDRAMVMSGADDDWVDNDSDEVQSQEAVNLIGARSSQRSTIQKELNAFKAEDMVATPRELCQLKRQSSIDLVSSPKRRILTRNAVQRKKVDYDMRFHPMDRAIRPMASATREKIEAEAKHEDADDERSSLSTATPSTRALRDCGGQIRTASIVSVDKPPENLLRMHISLKWEHLHDFDRRLHDLQGGVPEGGNALPMTWPRVVQRLMDEYHFTRKQFYRWGGTSALRERYQLIRQAVQGKQADSEAKDKEDQSLYWVEGFDVYDMKVGSKRYVNNNIPEYMQGIPRFTSRDLQRHKDEFTTSQQNMSTEESTELSGASQSNDTSDIYLGSSDAEAGIMGILERHLQEMEESQGAVEAANMLSGHHYNQNLPMNILFSTPRCAAKTTSENGLSRMNLETSVDRAMSKHVVPPLGSISKPLLQEELDTNSKLVTAAFLHGLSNSHGTIDRSSQIFTSERKASGQLQKTSIKGEQILGTTRKQLSRHKRIVKWSNSNFDLPEDEFDATSIIQKQSHRSLTRFNRNVTTETLPGDSDTDMQAVTVLGSVEADHTPQPLSPPLPIEGSDASGSSPANAVRAPSDCATRSFPASVSPRRQTCHTASQSAESVSLTIPRTRRHAADWMH